MSQIQRGSPFEFVLEQSRDLNEQMQGRAQDNAIDEAINTKARHKEERAENLTDVIQGGRERRKNKMLVGLQACHHQTANRKYDRADKIQTHEFCKKLALFCTKTRCDTELCIDDLFRKNGDDDRRSPGDQKGEIGNA